MVARWIAGRSRVHPAATEHHLTSSRRCCTSSSTCTVTDPDPHGGSRAKPAVAFRRERRDRARRAAVPDAALRHPAARGDADAVLERCDRLDGDAAWRGVAGGRLHRLAGGPRLRRHLPGDHRDCGREGAPITVEEFHTLNRCLDTAIAEAVTEHTRLIAQTRSQEEVERLGHTAHELRDLLNGALLAFHALKRGSVPVNGSTAAVLGRSLTGLSRSGRPHPFRGPSRRRASAARTRRDDDVRGRDRGGGDAPRRGSRRPVHRSAVDPTLIVDADPQLLASAVMNLLHNAFKNTADRRHGHPPRARRRPAALDRHRGSVRGHPRSERGFVSGLRRSTRRRSLRAGPRPLDRAPGRARAGRRYRPSGIGQGYGLHLHDWIAADSGTVGGGSIALRGTQTGEGRDRRGVHAPSRATAACSRLDEYAAAAAKRAGIPDLPQRTTAPIGAAVETELRDASVDGVTQQAGSRLRRCPSNRGRVGRASHVGLLPLTGSRPMSPPGCTVPHTYDRA